MPPNLDRVDWIGLTTEDPVDPQRRIIDAHLHLWDHEGMGRHLIADFVAETRGGHNVTDVVFIESAMSYRETGPELLRPVGETEFAAAQARASDDYVTRVAAIVALADVMHWTMCSTRTKRQARDGSAEYDSRSRRIRAPRSTHATRPDS
jgi:hypothetical protein